MQQPCTHSPPWCTVVIHFQTREVSGLEDHSGTLVEAINLPQLQFPDSFSRVRQIMPIIAGTGPAESGFAGECIELRFTESVYGDVEVAWDVG